MFYVAYSDSPDLEMLETPELAAQKGKVITLYTS